MYFSLVVKVPSGYSTWMMSLRRLVCLEGSPPASQISGFKFFLRGILTDIDSTERVDLLEEVDEEEEERPDMEDRGMMASRSGD